MENQTCCFTGHRKIPHGEIPKIEARIENEVLSLVEQGVTNFECGGALGFDTIAAQCIIRMKSQLPEMRLILILPCMDQADKWSETEKFEYNCIKVEADEVIYIQERYKKGCMLARNRHLIDDSQYCICYLNKHEGGTAYTVAYALQNHMKVINIAFP